MKWWYKFCDKTIESITGKKSNAGYWGFKLKCIVAWYTTVAVIAVLSVGLAYLTGCPYVHLAAVVPALLGLVLPLSVFKKKS